MKSIVFLFGCIVIMVFCSCNNRIDHSIKNSHNELSSSNSSGPVGLTEQQMRYILEDESFWYYEIDWYEGMENIKEKGFYKQSKFDYTDTLIWENHLSGNYGDYYTFWCIYDERIYFTVGWYEEGAYESNICTIDTNGNNYSVLIYGKEFLYDDEFKKINYQNNSLFIYTSNRSLYRYDLLTKEFKIIIAQLNDDYDIKDDYIHYSDMGVDGYEYFYVDYDGRKIEKPR